MNKLREPVPTGDAEKKASATGTVPNDEAGGVDISAGNAGERPADSKAAPPAYDVPYWWERISLNGRIAWMKNAGYAVDIAFFAANVPWKHLPTSCQVRLQRTPLPVNYDGSAY